MERLELKRLTPTAVLLLGSLLASLALFAQTQTRQTAARGLRLYVLDGGTIITNHPEGFGLTREQVKNTNFSCAVYLIVHPRGTLLFDTGLGDRYFGRPFNESPLGDRPDPPSTAGFVLVTKTLKGQLDEIGYPPSKIDYLAFSHPHDDHIGNANAFAGATFLVRQGDYDVMFGPGVKVNPAYSALKNSKTKMIEGDYDVFGDGTVVLLFTPGHTPGHQSLYVQLPCITSSASSRVFSSLFILFCAVPRTPVASRAGSGVKGARGRFIEDP